MLLHVSDEHHQGAIEGAIPFNTQFFHDEYDDGPAFDDMYDGDGGGSALGIDNEPGDRDLLAETQGTSRRVRPETVNYARRAKRVDVRKLKENIWKGLDIVVPPSQGLEDESEDAAMVRCLLGFFVTNKVHLLSSLSRRTQMVVHQQILTRLAYSHQSSRTCKTRIQKISCLRSARASALFASYTSQTNGD